MTRIQDLLVFTARRGNLYTLAQLILTMMFQIFFYHFTFLEVQKSKSSGSLYFFFIFFGRVPYYSLLSPFLCTSYTDLIFLEHDKLRAYPNLGAFVLAVPSVWNTLPSISTCLPFHFLPVFRQNSPFQGGL